MVFLLTILAGGLGAAARFAVDESIPARVRTRFPLGIMLVNTTGSFLLGLVVGLVAGLVAGAGSDLVTGVTPSTVGGGGGSANWSAIAGTGFLGGYTTFSTASLDSVRLFRERRWVAALINGPGMLIACVAAAACGAMLAR